MRGHKGRLGMGTCPDCRRQWYHFAEGWAKRWGTSKVYHLAAYAGMHDFYGDLHRIMGQEAHT
jgi:hypothetical protein